MENLRLLSSAIKKNEDKIMEALKTDLNKSNFEAYATEIGIVQEEINFMLKNMKRLLKTKGVQI